MSGPGPGLDHFMPGFAAPAGIVRAGAPIDPSVTPVAGREAVVAALREVHDPEIPVNIYDLGLVYDLDIHEDGSTRVAMTLTAPACPVAGEMPGWVAAAVAAVDGVGEVAVELVWEPPWGPEMMSEEARLLLDMY